MYQIIEQSLHNSQYKLEDVQEIEDSDDLGQERIEPPNSSPKLIKSTQKQPIMPAKTIFRNNMDTSISYDKIVI